MKKFPCLTDEFGKKVLLKDYGDTCSFTIFCISKTDAFVKIDKRIKSVEDFKKLYDYKATYTEESMEDAFTWKPLNK